MDGKKKKIKSKFDNTDVLNEKQRCFCRQYIIDLNATQAAIRAGYSERTANEQASRLLANVKIKGHISELIKAKNKQEILTSDEVLKLLTKFAKGEEEEECIVTESQGDGISQARIIAKKIVPRDRIKALETLAKYHKLTDNTEREVEVKVSLQDIHANSQNISKMLTDGLGS